jgi:hypothetical protein
MRNSSGPDPLPTGEQLCAVVWRHLEKYPDSRPLQVDIARALGIAPRRLRRAWQDTGHNKIREMITYGCLSYAQWLIYSEHCKVVAAVQLAGFKTSGMPTASASDSRDARSRNVETDSRSNSISMSC